MSLISFKNIKLFKSSGPARAPQPPKEEPESGPAKLLQNPFFFIFLTSLVLASFLSYVPTKSLPEFKPGDIATADVIASADLIIEDADTTEARRQAAVEAVLPVYGFDPNVFLNIEDKVRQFFLSGRQWLKTAPPAKDYALIQKTITDKFGLDLTTNDIAALEKAEFGADLETILLGLLEKHARPGLILSKSLFINRELERGFTLLRGTEGEKAIRASEILEIKEVKERFVAEINGLDLAARKKGLLISLAYGFVAPNVTFNKVETEARKEKARAGVSPAFFSIKKGRVIARKGDEVTPDEAKLIRAINQGAQTRKGWLANFLGTFLLFGLLMLTIWFYLRSLAAARTALKHYLMLGLTIALSLLLYKSLGFVADTLSQSARFFLFADADSYKFAFPYQFGVLLFAFLTTNTVALIYAILNSLLIGYLFNANYFLMIFSLIGGLAAIYGIKIYQRQRRTATLRAGFFLVAPLNLFVILTFSLIKPRGAEPVGALAAEGFMAIIGGLLSAALAFVLLPIYENIFRFVTQSKLLELTNSDSEIFRQMALEAPGSYHHSLIVASLAEKAAEAIRADVLLVKAGALYHDIGKIKMPEYFIENRNRKIDAHKDLTPSMSTLVIINHVKEGVEIARKEKLPAEILEMIEQHHGNSLVRYFYLKAKEKVDPEMEKIGEETYRYPGPRPQTKEAAMVMLADSVEAASKSLKNQNEDNLKRVIRDIFDNYLTDGQLDDCSFSLKELQMIAASFLATLLTVYQQRPGYPGFEFESKPRKKAERPPKKDNHDRNHHPTEEG